MSDAVYPTLPGLSWPLKRVPMFKTLPRSTASGREFRTRLWTVPRLRYLLQYEFLRSSAAEAEYQALWGFFGLRSGAYDTFLFSDLDDRAASAQPFGTGDGTTTAFQLVSSYGGYSMPVTAIDATAGAPTLFVNGVAKATPADYTLSATGLVTFTAAPAAAAVLTWTGYFYRRVRFDMDELDAEQFMRFFWKTGQVRFITDKP